MKNVVTVTVVAFVVALSWVSTQAEAPFVEFPVAINFTVTLKSNSLRMKACTALAATLAGLSASAQQGKSESSATAEIKRKLEVSTSTGLRELEAALSTWADLVYKNPQISPDVWFGFELAVCEEGSNVRPLSLIGESDAFNLFEKKQ